MFFKKILFFEALIKVLVEGCGHFCLDKIDIWAAQKCSKLSKLILNARNGVSSINVTKIPLRNKFQPK